MALTGTESALAAGIKTELLADAATGAVDGSALDALSLAIATAVIAHLTGAAGAGAVNPLGLLAPPGAGGGPVTGAGSLQ
jgi:hypothetical protein